MRYYVFCYNVAVTLAHVAPKLWMSFDKDGHNIHRCTIVNSFLKYTTKHSVYKFFPLPEADYVNTHTNLVIFLLNNREIPKRNNECADECQLFSFKK